LRASLVFGVAAAVVLALQGCTDSAEELPAPGSSAVIATYTPSPSAGGFDFDNPPPPDAGYAWYVYPVSAFGLPRYAVQIPADWVAAYPGESDPQLFTPSGQPPGSGALPNLEAFITPATESDARVFRVELPRQGQACGILDLGEEQVVGRAWEMFQLKCPESSQIGSCQADAKAPAITCNANDPGVPLRTFSAVAAEVRVGDFKVAFLLRHTEEASSRDPVFQHALSTVVLGTASK
jgi:hypothetical protein